MTKKQGIILALISLVSLCLSSVAVMTAVKLNEQAKNYDVQYVLYLGTNSNKNNEPVFATEEAKLKADLILFKYFDGFTIQEASGGWKNDDGSFSHEYTFVIYLSGTTREKVYEAISQSFKKAYYDLILVDYSYGQDNFDGLDVIRFIRKSHPKDDLILYSANQKEVIGRVVGENLQNESTENIVAGINELMNFRIAKIVPRTSMDAEVITYLREDTTFSPYGFISNMLKENRDKVFKSCYPKLSGKTYGEIADMLDSESNGRANEWLSAILEQLIVYLSEVNE